MSKKFIFMTLFLALALAVSASPATAKAPLDVYIISDKDIGGIGDFVATGPAVDAGLVCPSGTEVDPEVIVRNTAGGRFTILKILKSFTCEDGSGTFDVRMTVKLFPDGTTTANWKVVAGTGNYTALRGHGTLVGTPPPNTTGEIIDEYFGKMK